MDKPPKPPEAYKFQYNSEAETGWDRLKAMYSRDENGAFSEELKFSLNGAMGGLWSGLLIGCFESAKAAQEHFKMKNQETIYTHQYEAQRKFTDFVAREMMRHGWKWGWRLSLFAGTFMTISTTLSIYRNRVAIQDFTFSGLIAGSLWRFNRGIRATFSSAIVAGTLGTAAGAVIFTMFWATGNSVAEMRYWGHHGYIADLKKRSLELNLKKQKEEKEKDENAEENVKLLIWHEKNRKKNNQETPNSDSPQ